MEKPVGNDEAVEYFRAEVRAQGSVSAACDVFGISLGMGSYICYTSEPVLPTTPIRRILAVKANRAVMAALKESVDIARLQYKGRR